MKIRDGRDLINKNFTRADIRKMEEEVKGKEKADEKKERMSPEEYKRWMEEKRKKREAFAFHERKGRRMAEDAKRGHD